MRIAILADFPVHTIPELGLGEPGGHYATWLPQLAEAFESCVAHEIHWVTITREAMTSREVRWKNQTFHLLPNPKKLRALRLYARDLSLIGACLRSVKPDLVHAWGTEDCYALAGAFSPETTLISVQGILSHYVRMAPMHPLVWLQSVYERIALRRARQLTAESPWACEIARSLAPNATINRVDYGVPERFYQVKWQPDPTKPVALFVGTPDRRKGIQDAVEAFRSEKLQKYELWIVGDGGISEQLKVRSTPNIRWLGRKSVAAVTEMMSRAWCLIIPTRADTGPTVVKEARVVGLPAITTRCGGQRDYITAGGNGYFVEPQCIGALQDSVEMLLGDYETARRMGGFQHEEQRAFFRPENTAQNFLRLYQELSFT